MKTAVGHRKVEGGDGGEREELPLAAAFLIPPILPYQRHGLSGYYILEERVGHSDRQREED